MAAAGTSVIEYIQEKPEAEAKKLNSMWLRVDSDKWLCYRVDELFIPKKYYRNLAARFLKVFSNWKKLDLE